MQRLKPIPRLFLIPLTILSLVLCPLTSIKFLPSNNALAGDQLQIEFTPHITPLALTQTAESIGFDPNLRTTPSPSPTLGPGQYFEEVDKNKPELDSDTIVGDMRFGFAQLIDNPNLYAVWITDADGTHYLIVESKNEVLTGGSDPKRGFIYLADRRETLQDQILRTYDQMTKHYNTANNFRLGSGSGAIVWALCVWFTGGWCLPALGIAGAFYGLSENKDNDAEIQQILIEGYRDEFFNCEKFMRGKFKVGQAIYDQP